MESLAQVIEKAVEKQQVAMLKHLSTVHKRVIKLYQEAGDLQTDLAELIATMSGGFLVQLSGDKPAKKPRAAIAVPSIHVLNLFEDLKAAGKPLTLSEIVAPALTNRSKAAALRQLAAEGKVQQVKGGKWQAVVAEKMEAEQ